MKCGGTFSCHNDYGALLVFGEQGPGMGDVLQF